MASKKSPRAQPTPLHVLRWAIANGLEPPGRDYARTSCKQLRAIARVRMVHLHRYLDELGYKRGKNGQFMPFSQKQVMQVVAYVAARRGQAALKKAMKRVPG